MKKENEEMTIPQASKGDVAHLVVKAGISALPGIGGPAAELFQFIVQPPLEKRREAWMQIIGEKLRELEEKGIDLASLKNDEQFISTVTHASQAALRTHKEEKLIALRNAILNVAQGKGPDETTQHLLLNFIDELSEMHIRILKVFQNPTPSPGIGMGGLNHVLEYNIPDLRGHRGLYNQLWRDLYIRGLVNTDSLNLTMSRSGLAERRTARLGDELINFISEY